MGFVNSLSQNSLSPIRGALLDIPVSLYLKKLDKKDYSVIGNYSVNNSNSVIDYVIISKYGIFLINLKNIGGTLSSAELEEQWIFKTVTKENTIENPNLEIQRLTKNLSQLIPIDEKKIIPVTVFNPGTKFKNIRSKKLIKSSQLIKWIKEYEKPILDDNELDLVLYSILHKSSKPELNITNYPIIKMENGVKGYYCPKCGSKLNNSEIETQMSCSNSKNCNFELKSKEIY